MPYSYDPNIETIDFVLFQDSSQYGGTWINTLHAVENVGYKNKSGHERFLKTSDSAKPRFKLTESLNTQKLTKYMDNTNIVANVPGTGTAGDEYRYLGAGEFAAVFGIEDKDGRQFVLKVSDQNSINITKYRADRSIPDFAAYMPEIYFAGKLKLHDDYTAAENARYGLADFPSAWPSATDPAGAGHYFYVITKKYDIIDDIVKYTAEDKLKFFLSLTASLDILAHNHYMVQDLKPANIGADKDNYNCIYIDYDKNTFLNVNGRTIETAGTSVISPDWAPLVLGKGNKLFNDYKNLQDDEAIKTSMLPYGNICYRVWFNIPESITENKYEKIITKLIESYPKTKTDDAKYFAKLMSYCTADPTGKSTVLASLITAEDVNAAEKIINAELHIRNVTLDNYVQPSDINNKEWLKMELIRFGKLNLKGIITAKFSGTVAETIGAVASAIAVVETKYSDFIIAPTWTNKTKFLGEIVKAMVSTFIKEIATLPNADQLPKIKPDQDNIIKATASALALDDDVGNKIKSGDIDGAITYVNSKLKVLNIQLLDGGKSQLKDNILSKSVSTLTVIITAFLLNRFYDWPIMYIDIVKQGFSRNNADEDLFIYKDDILGPIFSDISTITGGDKFETFMRSLLIGENANMPDDSSEVSKRSPLKTVDWDDMPTYADIMKIIKLSTPNDIWDIIIQKRMNEFMQSIEGAKNNVYNYLTTLSTNYTNRATTYSKNDTGIANINTVITTIAANIKTYTSEYNLFEKDSKNVYFYLADRYGYTDKTGTSISDGKAKTNYTVFLRDMKTYITDITTKLKEFSDYKTEIEKQVTDAKATASLTGGKIEESIKETINVITNPKYLAYTLKKNIPNKIERKAVITKLKFNPTRTADDLRQYITNFTKTIPEGKIDIKLIQPTQSVSHNANFDHHIISIAINPGSGNIDHQNAQTGGANNIILTKLLITIPKKY